MPRLRVYKNRIKNRDELLDPDSKFYKKNFIKMPRDAITERFKKVFKREFYKRKLSSLLNVQMLPNFKEIKIVPMKRIPLYDKLIAGKYEEGYANYDHENVRVNINFFVNNLPSFKKYRGKNELDWVISKHRLLALEIFEYYTEPSISTLESRFNSILRIMRIAYKTKQLPLYQLFSTIVFQLHGKVTRNEGKNKLNKYELKKYIHWQDVMKVHSMLEKDFNALKNKKTREAYDLHNELLLLSIYCLIPPLRNEVKHLEFTRSSKDKKIDYVYISRNDKEIVLKFHKIKKQHRPVFFNITKWRYKNPHLIRIIKESFELYPRQYLFTLKYTFPKTNKKASGRALDERLIHIFNKYGITNRISVNSLRSSYVSHLFSQRDTRYNDKVELAYRMRTSLECLERSYNKVVNNSPILADKNFCHKCDECDDNENDNDFIVNDNDKKEGPKGSDGHEGPKGSEGSEGPKGSEGSEGPKGSEGSEGSESQENSGESVEKDNEPELTQYELKLLRNRTYYEENREYILEQQKEYKSKKTPFEKTRERTVQLLNASPDYANAIRKSTIEKYKIYYDENSSRWIWHE